MRMIVCDECNGSGGGVDIDVCLTCNGTGRVEDPRGDCEACDGTGEILTDYGLDWEQCRACGGTGKV
jgi:DnaJ-class molecular chaperone